MFHGGPARKLRAELVIQSFNKKHFHRIGRGDGIGLGGLIPPVHAKKLLLENGHQVKAAQIVE